MNKLPREFCSKSVNLVKSQNLVQEKTDYSIPFQFSQDVMKGKRKVIVSLPCKEK